MQTDIARLTARKCLVVGCVANWKLRGVGARLYGCLATSTSFSLPFPSPRFVSTRCAVWGAPPIGHSPWGHSVLLALPLFPSLPIAVLLRNHVAPSSGTPAARPHPLRPSHSVHCQLCAFAGCLHVFIAGCLANGSLLALFLPQFVIAALILPRLCAAPGPVINVLMYTGVTASQPASQPATSSGKFTSTGEGEGGSSPKGDPRRKQAERGRDARGQTARKHSPTHSLQNPGLAAHNKARKPATLSAD